MRRIWGRSQGREDLLRHPGRLKQAEGVRLVTLGAERVLGFRTASGFALCVVVDRAFDIGVL